MGFLAQSFGPVPLLHPKSLHDQCLQFLVGRTNVHGYPRKRAIQLQRLRWDRLIEKDRPMVS